MEAGSYVWCSADPKGDEAWILAEVLKKGDTQIELQQVDKKEHVFTRPLAKQEDEDSGERKFEGVELANAPLSEAEIAEGRDNDLITLPHLHEPAILHTCSERFMRGKIYTWTGPVLIAVNPFERLPLYTDVSFAKQKIDGWIVVFALYGGISMFCFFLCDSTFFFLFVFFLTGNSRALQK